MTPAELWIRWGGVVPGDHVLTGGPGCWVWWEVAATQLQQDGGTLVTLKGASGATTTGRPDPAAMVRVRPASVQGWQTGPAAEREALAAAMSLCAGRLGARAIPG